MPQDQSPMPTPDAQQTSGSDELQPHGGHGTSVAAWTATLGVTFGSFVVALGMIFVWMPVIIGGVVVIVLSALAAPVLSRAGYGEHSADREATGGPRSVR